MGELAAWKNDLFQDSWTEQHVVKSRLVSLLSFSSLNTCIRFISLEMM